MDGLTNLLETKPSRHIFEYLTDKEFAVNKCGFRLYGKKYNFETAKATYLNALRVMRKKHPDLYKLLGSIKNTRELGYFANTPEEVFIKSPELGDRTGLIEKLEAGWYTNTNLSNKEKENILLLACGITGVKYHDEFEIWFDGGNNKYTPPSKEEADHQLSLILDQLKI